MSDVKDMSKERQKRAAKNAGKTEKPPRPVEVFYILSQIINGEGGARHAEFPRRYYVFEPEAGTRLILRARGGEDGSLIEIVQEEALVNDMVTYAKENFGAFPELQLTHKQATDAMRYWRATAPIIPMPSSVSWTDEEGFTFHRLPWAVGEAGPTPTWDSFLSRLSNREAFTQWIGSLFIPAANHQQYLWVQGEGGEGKGAIDRFLEKVMGSGYRSEQPPARGDRFWAYGLVGARLVAFADCNAAGFPASGMFKSLCANDAMRCEPKGGKVFSMRLGCRFVFYSNERPDLSTEKADMRRIIYCEFEKREDTTLDPTFEQRLWHEGGYFLTKCINAYLLNYPEHGPIATETEEIESWAMTMEAHLEEIFSENFKLDPHSNVTSNEMAAIVRGWIKDRPTRNQFYAYIARVYGLKGKCKKENGHVFKTYRGIRIINRSGVLSVFGQ